MNAVASAKSASFSFSDAWERSDEQQSNRRMLKNGHKLLIKRHHDAYSIHNAVDFWGGRTD